IQGTASAVCTNGQWAPSQLGTCIGFPGNGGTSIVLQDILLISASTCPAVATPLGAILSYSNLALLGPFPEGTTVTARCLNGAAVIGGKLYEIELNTVYEVKCEVRKGCIAGLMLYSFSSLLGVSTAKCTSSQWVPSTLGTCPSSGSESGTEFPCYLGLLEPLNGSISYTSSKLPYPPGTIATLTCKVGYMVSGAATSVCVNGSFTTIGTCNALWLQRRTFNDVVGPENQGLFCEAPAAPAFGEITFSNTSSPSGFVSGTTATLRCSFGRSITGPSFSICSQGMFRPVLGQCTNDKQSVLPFTGVCLPLSAPTNGRITYIQPRRQDKIEIGTTALLYCLESFAVTGQATVVCTKNGWRPATGLGQCDSTNSISASLRV
ncbi:unnamed protein product, partial [Angiostrongylus costaricensis]|uniref:Sushi domain-containing protein n=1 Tax=Angiostrongylus costaricensis TaxID=334426 RepID=A0A0R3PM05_ANGCS